MVKNRQPLNYDPAHRPRRQDWDGVLVENGAFYFTDVRIFLETRSRLGGRSVVYQMPPEYAVDIDTIDDLQYCELALKKYRLQSSK